ncbi:low molecular weight phosphatase family protein [Amylibacter sp. IMCC11727]|uniref:arsenate-mycothiol transferase ArsC n=1 Tax=Amylibacter sp. IMCC11727 TaxID=3039851 RepID=UPI00244DC006|nr:low molecular weight phosphatase family protein [Amylibacter sp. IMCC11727]WGI22191.1 low molecular weight phosphatase family protein [Amylibacter sp. IMCC11727]
MSELFQPQSVLFACDHNSIRSPMAEGLLKQHVGTSIFVQSAGVKGDMEIDGFAINVCREVGVELSRHRTRSFDDLMEWGDDLDSYDLIVALSPAAQRRALEYTRFYSLEVEYWQTMDPSGFGDNREAKLNQYRLVRDQIAHQIQQRFTAV